jgi:hypothetical protein
LSRTRAHGGSRDLVRLHGNFADRNLRGERQIGKALVRRAVGATVIVADVFHERLARMQRQSAAQKDARIP